MQRSGIPWMSARRFDALLIDFYGTICAADRLTVESICRRVVDAHSLSVSPQELAIRWGCRFFETVDHSNHHSFQTLFQCEAVSLRATMADLGTEIDPRPYIAELERYWCDPPLYDDALTFLERLDIPVCCVSNADTEPLLTAISKYGLRFAAVVSSEAARCYKPEPHIFHLALAALDVSPDRALHVGDSLHSDVGGAAGVGIPTAWVHREDLIHDIGLCDPDFIVFTLYEIADLVAGKVP